MNARRAILVLLVLAGIAALSRMMMPQLLVRAQGLVVGSYQLVSERRVSRTDFEYTYTAVLANPGPALASAAAHVTSQSPRTVLVDADLTFGAVPAGGAATSQDTFTFWQDRTVSFTPADLVWTVTPVAANQPPDCRHRAGWPGVRDAIGSAGRQRVVGSRRQLTHVPMVSGQPAGGKRGDRDRTDERPG